MTTAFPLSWPDQFPRSRHRERGQFRTKLGVALVNVETSLRRFGADSGKAVAGVVLSSNVTLGVPRPADPGVAVWFTWDGAQRCIPVDRYDSPEANLQAIHHVLEARRVELRHGTLALVRATFAGFTALPAPSEESWERVLGVARDASAAEVAAAFRAAAKLAHPDMGGSDAAMARLNRAMEQWKRAAGG